MSMLQRYREMGREALDRDTSYATKKEESGSSYAPKEFLFIFKTLTEFQMTEVIGRHLCKNADHNI